MTDSHTTKVLFAWFTKVFKFPLGNMNDAMIGRCFGRVNKEINLKDAENILIQNKAECRNYAAN